MQVATLPPMNLPIVCYLIQLDNGKNILVDSGLPDTTPPGIQPPVESKNVIEQLVMIGLKPADISQVICTHFDADHSGQHAAFAQAEFVVQRAHFDEAKINARFAATRSQWNQPSLHYLFLESDTTLYPGLELVRTDEHTLGHQSILMRLPETGPVLLTIDAIPSQESYQAERQLGSRDGGSSVGTKKLLNLIDREHITTIVFGHDSQQWRTLKKLPDYYS
jgi:N-acyl homoserine lactone hydrolase